MRYQLYEDYQKNKERLDIIGAARRITVPFLICHGRQDPAVPVSAAARLHEANPSSELFILDTDHVFGRQHPRAEPALPQAMEQVLARNITFFHAALGHR